MRNRHGLAVDCAVNKHDGRPPVSERGVWPSAQLRARKAFGAHFGLASNAGAMVLATVVNGGFGFIYWWVSARAFTPQAVGLASAGISLISLLSLAADLGLGTLLMGEIPRQRALAPHLVSAALLASLASSSAFGLAYLLLDEAFAQKFGVPGGATLTGLLILVGIGAQTTSAVLDAALVGMLNAPLRLFRNLLFALSKLLIVGAAAALVVPEDWQVNAIIASWVVGQGLAGLALIGVLRYRGARVWHRPRFDLLKNHFGTAIWHYALNVVATAPGLILPMIITVALSPQQNAPFYAAWMLLNLSSVVPTALASVLFTVGSRHSASAISSVRFSLVVSLGVGALAAVGFWLLSSAALDLLNPVYSNLVGSDLRFLGVSVPLVAVKVHYMSVQRLAGRVRTATFALAVLGTIEILFAALGAEVGGLFGVTTGWLIAMAIEALCLWPTIWRSLGVELIGFRTKARGAWKRLGLQGAARSPDRQASFNSSEQDRNIAPGRGFD